MKKIIVTGSQGLIGSKFIKAYRERYELVPFDLRGEKPVDILERQGLREAMKQNRDASAVVHLAAYTDVNGAYQQRGDKNGLAWQINVTGTANVAAECRQWGIYLIHLSTAYVFDGEKKTFYREEDEMRPIEWYGESKAEAEKRVRESGAEAVILRIDQPFSREEFVKVDTLHRVIAGLEEGTLSPQFTTHYFGPTYIEDLSKILDFCIRKKVTGLYHASSGEKWSDFEFAGVVKEILGLAGEVTAGDLEKYLRTLGRPYQRNTALSNKKLRGQLDFTLKTVREAMVEVKKERLK